VTASAAVQVRSSLCLDVTQCRLVISYIYFGRTYRSSSALKKDSIGFPETSVNINLLYVTSHNSKDLNRTHVDIAFLTQGNINDKTLNFARC
jgi:hypothetical protein